MNAGDTDVDGRDGTDVVLFRGACAEYALACDGDASCVVVDSVRDRDGTTETTNVQVLAFADGDYDFDDGCEAPRSEAAATCWALVPEPADGESPADLESGGARASPASALGLIVVISLAAVSR